MIKFQNQQSILFEPVYQIIYTYDNNDDEKIINQDSSSRINVIKFFDKK